MPSSLQFSVFLLVFSLPVVGSPRRGERGGEEGGKRGGRERGGKRGGGREGNRDEVLGGLGGIGVAGGGKEAGAEAVEAERVAEEDGAPDAEAA